ncbi:MAG TPA: 50S ribosomal protein L19 [Candidatus Omnitrophota bacterium]|nr:50S ribosomal protein L19 [Candidatus Omnitrophota bacterium]HQL41334.1 50S ribosomal protein L19 [Candidatus Omnitrophota bacterium]
MAINIGETIKNIENKYQKELPPFKVGDQVKMFVKVAEGDKVRLHPFEGTVVRKTGRGLRGIFTIRKVSFGEGVERTFPLCSPVVDSLKVVAKGVAKRSRLYYLRARTGKSARMEKEDVAVTAAPSSS